MSWVVLVAPSWTANFDDIPMETASSSATGASGSGATAPAAMSESDGWSSATSSGKETGWADFSNCPAAMRSVVGQPDL